MRIARLLAVPLLLSCTRNAEVAHRGTAASPAVTIDAGALSGVVDTSGVLLFRGIPYAAPPVDDGRWRAPGPVAPWSGVRAATALGHNCMQGQPYGDIDPYAAGISEDCLYLNVWTTDADASAKRPVMVWLHGGGYMAGFGGEERHNGARLAQKGAVVVTLNYRLGVYGFLAHPALVAESPNGSAGNYGLLDQVAALRWVQRNIARFGGDPSRVTIFGESAGGLSVGSLIASPLAKGLFHRAILQSGDAVGGAHRIDTVSAEGLAFATTMGITGTSAGALAQLRALSADSLLHAMLPPNGTGGVKTAFNPRVTRDGWVVPRSVDSALALGTANVVPVIVGATGDEGDGTYATSRSLARLVTAQKANAYLYVFTRVGEDSAAKARGAYHSADITFTFGRPRTLLASAGHTSYDAALADAMSDYFVSFAATGNPNRGNRPAWPVYDPGTDAYMDLGATIGAGTNRRRIVLDSLDAKARARGQVRP